jgi:hypothetical protein
VTVILCIWSADAAQAIDRRVRIVNDSKQEIVEFFAVNVGAGASEHDMLGEAGVPPGGSVILSFEDGSGYCRFRFRAVFRDGVVLSRDSVNICEVGTYRYTD